MNIRAAILGPTGYAGLALIELLLNHPAAEPSYLASRRDALPDIREEFPRLSGRLDDATARCRPIDADAIADEADVVFLALPHRAAMRHVPALLDAGLRVIDLSADYRLRDPDLYARTYDHPHGDVENLAEAVYGMPELGRGDLPGAMLVANPGCYPTAAVLGAAPLINHSLVKTDRLVVNAASGVTGAGRKTVSHLHFPEHNQAFMPYGTIGGHRHQPEIEQALADAAGHAVSTLFVPHLLPVDRGILATIYFEPADPEVSEDELFEAYEDMYQGEPFVRMHSSEGRLPNIKHVVGTNFCDVSVRLTRVGEQPMVVAFSAIDNILKGAAGLAIQNMNLVFEQPETAGLL